jgi:hypothetical protein
MSRTRLGWENKLIGCVIVIIKLVLTSESNQRCGRMVEAHKQCTFSACIHVNTGLEYPQPWINSYYCYTWPSRLKYKIQITTQLNKLYHKLINYDLLSILLTPPSITNI